MESKGLKPRKMLTLIGWVTWRRHVRRCGTCGGHVAPLDKALGLQPHQRSSDELKRAGCALAVFVPFGVGERLLKMLTGVRVCDKSLWAWVQERGQIVMAQLQALAAGDVPEEEGLEAETRALPLLAGADGVMVPFRPEAGTPTGKTV